MQTYNVNSTSTKNIQAQSSIKTEGLPFVQNGKVILKRSNDGLWLMATIIRKAGKNNHSIGLTIQKVTPRKTVVGFLWL